MTNTPPSPQGCIYIQLKVVFCLNLARDIIGHLVSTVDAVLKLVVWNVLVSLYGTRVINDNLMSHSYWYFVPTVAVVL